MRDTLTSGFCRTFVVGALFAGALVLGTLSCGFASAAEPTFQKVSNITYVKRGNDTVAADVYVPDGPGPYPGVLVVHGGAWFLGSKSRMTHIAETLARHGYVAMSINYRLAPQSAFPAQIEDCQAAVRWMRENAVKYKIDPTRIGGYGYSAGGQLVALLATCDEPIKDAAEAPPFVKQAGASTRLQAVVAGGAPCEFRLIPERSSQLTYWLGGTRAEKPDLYEAASPMKFISQDDPPMFFYHGENDSLVPIASPQGMVRRLTAAGVASTLYVVPRGTHITTFLDATAATEALKFLDLHLKTPAKSPAK